MWISKPRPFCSAMCRNVCSRYAVTSATVNVRGSMGILPASTFDRSRISFISWRRSFPEACTVYANFTCSMVRLPSRLSARVFERMSRLLSGVRSSCDMFARNSDLYLEMSWSCSAFSSKLRLASSTSWFFTSRSFALSFNSVACASSSAFDVLSCCKSSSVRMLEEIMFRMTPTLPIS